MLLIYLLCIKSGLFHAAKIRLFPHICIYILFVFVDFLLLKGKKGSAVIRLQTDVLRKKSARRKNRFVGFVFF